MRIGVIADSHVSVDERRFEPVSWHNEFKLPDSLERFTAALAHPLIAGSDVVTVLGDLVHWGDRASLRAVVDAAGGCGRPVILLSGNHDVTEAGVRLEQEVIAASHSNVWSPQVATVPDAITAPFAAAGVGLQVVEVMEMRTLDASTAPLAAAGLGLAVVEVTEMRVTDEPAPEDKPFAVEARTVLAGRPGGPGVLLTHFPVLSFRWRAVEAELLYSGNLRDLAAPPELDLGWGATLVMNGHLHIRGVRAKETTYQISFGALIEAPYDVAAVDVEWHDETLDVTYECASMRPVDEEVVPVLDPPTGRHRITRSREAAAPAS